MQIPRSKRTGKNSNHLPTLQGKDDKTHIKEVVNLEAWENEDDKHLQRMLEVGDETKQWVIQKSREYLKLMSYYRCAMMEVETRFNVLNQEHILEHDRNPISTVKSRLKTLPSIEEKLSRRGFPLSVASAEENLNDIAGVRVICSFPEDVYAMAEAFLGQDDVVLLSRKDYIKEPKPNGYRSLHLVVAIPIYLTHEKRMIKVEIQMRTIAMDFWASLEHQLRYKKDTAFTPAMADELYRCAQLSAALDIRMDNLRRSVRDASAQAEGDSDA